jgi:hypothetical protein
MVQLSAEVRESFPLENAQTRLWAYPAFYSTKALSPGIQRPDREADPSPPSSKQCAELYLPFPYVCMAYMCVPVYSDVTEQNIRCGKDTRDARKNDEKIIESGSL